MRVQLATGNGVEYADAGQGRTLVLLHGFPLDRAMWRPQLEALRDDYRVLVPSQRGFGGSEGFSGPPSLDQMADDAAGLLDALGIREPVALGGLSMGGYVALAFARRHPQRLRALLLADTRAEADSAEGRANRDKTIAFMQTHTASDLIEQMLPKLLGNTTRAQRPEVAAELRRIASAQSTSGIAAALQAMRDRPDATPGLARIAVPTLVLVGSEDTLTPLAAAQVLVAGIRGARLTVIDGAGHMSNLEQPEGFTGAMRAFLQTLS
jgi:pimeloyl-ACP methyl ester carboxylesterase